VFLAQAVEGGQSAEELVLMFGIIFVVSTLLLGSALWFAKQQWRKYRHAEDPLKGLEWRR